jgi:hypothetical protein
MGAPSTMTDLTGAAVLITCRHEAILLLKWLRKSRARAICTSVNAYLILCSEGLRDTAELIDAPLAGDKANEIVLKAERLARKVDADIARCLCDVTGLYISQGWDFWDKLLFAKSLLPVREWLQTQNLTALPERIAFCHFANAQDYHHPSLVRSQLFFTALRQAGKHPVKIPLGFPLTLPHTPEVWRSKYRVSGKYLEGARLLHVPSAFYAQSELVGLYGHEGFLGLESPFYENPILRRRIELDREATAVREWPFDVADARLIYQEFAEATGLAGLEGMSQQLNHWLERLAFQYRAFKMLVMLRDRYGVSLAALADHDGGLFGPLCSAFHGQKEPVTIFPHSTICVGPLPRLDSKVIGVMESLRPLEPFDGACLPSPQLARGSPRPLALGGDFVIVLNEIDDVSGLPVHGLHEMLDFVEALASALAAKGFRPVLRARPSTPVQACRRLEIDTWDGDLGELIGRSAACIGVGQVTSAVARFWSAGVVCLQVQDRELRVHDQYLLPAGGVECFSGRPFMEMLPTLLDFIDGLVTDLTSE